MKNYQVTVKIEDGKMKMTLVNEVEVIDALEAYDKIWWELSREQRNSIVEVSIKLVPF